MDASLRQHLKAAGTVMNLWPIGDYSEYLRTDSYQNRLRQHWVKTGQYLIRAVADYEQAQSALTAPIRIC